jgi:hypothetical protein
VRKKGNSGGKHFVWRKNGAIRSIGILTIAIEKYYLFEKEDSRKYIQI